MGDLVDNGQDASQWRAWFNSVSVFSDAVPLAPVIGNHEAYNMEWKEYLPASYTHLFNVPQNGLAKYPNQFYSFDYGSVHFVVLDTNFPEMKNSSLICLQMSCNGWKRICRRARRRGRLL